MSRDSTKVLGALQAAAKRNPDLRIGQLLCIALRNNGRQLDMFNVENDDLAALLDSIVARIAVPAR